MENYHFLKYFWAHKKKRFYYQVKQILDISFIAYLAIKIFKKIIPNKNIAKICPMKKCREKRVWNF